MMWTIENRPYWPHCFFCNSESYFVFHISISSYEGKRSFVDIENVLTTHQTILVQWPSKIHKYLSRKNNLFQLSHFLRSVYIIIILVCPVTLERAFGALVECAAMETPSLTPAEKPCEDQKVFWPLQWLWKTAFLSWLRKSYYWTCDSTRRYLVRGYYSTL